jgi:hypothetical protein
MPERHLTSLIPAAAAAAVARYVQCVVAKAAADGRTTYGSSVAMLKALLLGLPLVQPGWLAESLAAGQLLPVESRHLIKVGAVLCCAVLCCDHWSTRPSLQRLQAGQCSCCG